jgi:hypothetical protein
VTRTSRAIASLNCMYIFEGDATRRTGNLGDGLLA